jgi:hypothetical protein
MIDINIFRQQVETSLQQAVTNALERKRRLGQYAVIAENGQPRRIGPEEIGLLLDKQARLKPKQVPE